MSTKCTVADLDTGRGGERPAFVHCYTEAFDPPSGPVYVLLRASGVATITAAFPADRFRQFARDLGAWAERADARDKDQENAK